jgi:exodeoxyribonuclease VII large subunit
MPSNGEKVLVHGRIRVYEAVGQYQFYIDDMQPIGAGLIAMETERIRKKLEEEGLFDSERKKPLPIFPGMIGIVTSPQGAAFQDIKTTIEKRYPPAQLIICPVQVQGEGAAQMIAETLARINKISLIDVIIIARGGGSLEELSAFNTERVARAVAVSEIPVISGVGHQTDYTLCDFAADFRAATPTAAATAAVPVLTEVLDSVHTVFSRTRQSLKDRCLVMKKAVNSASIWRLIPKLEREHTRRCEVLKSSYSRIKRAIAYSISRKEDRRGYLWDKTLELNPKRLLSRGYTIVYDKGNIVSKAENIAPGDLLNVVFSDGSVWASVLEKRGGK